MASTSQLIVIAAEDNLLEEALILIRKCQDVAELKSAAQLVGQINPQNSVCTAILNAINARLNELDKKNRLGY